VEYAGDSHEGGGPRHQLHFGTEYKVKPHQRLDLYVGSDYLPPPWTISSGLVTRFGCKRCGGAAWNIWEFDSTDARAYSRL
jgi:hypothetical protein